MIAEAKLVDRLEMYGDDRGICRKISSCLLHIIEEEALLVLSGCVVIAEKRNWPLLLIIWTVVLGATVFALASAGRQY